MQLRRKGVQFTEFQEPRKKKKEPENRKVWEEEHLKDNSFFPGFRIQQQNTHHFN